MNNSEGVNAQESKIIEQDISNIIEENKTNSQNLLTNYGNKCNKNSIMDKETNDVQTGRESSVIEMESLCMNCNSNGQTRILLWDIPFFREVVVMSFECEKCGFKNNEVQMAQGLQEKAVKFTLKVCRPDEMHRMAAINSRAQIYIPEIDLEIPATTQAVVTTIQGLFEGFAEDLAEQCNKMKILNQDTLALTEYVNKLKKFVECNEDVFPFHLILTDFSGNSFISQPNASLHDSNLRVEKFFRTKEQQEALGYIASNQEDELPKNVNKASSSKKLKMTNVEAHNLIKKMQGSDKQISAHKLDYSKPLEEQESMNNIVDIENECYVCFKLGKFRTCQIEIPFFKEVIIMSFSCDNCGYKNTEVKTMGTIPEKGRKIILNIKDIDDLNRDLFKSDTATVYIPELEFEMSAGSLGSFYTTVEGLLEKIIENLKLQNPFVGDSSEKEQTQNFEIFLAKLLQMKEGKILPFKLIIDDPLDDCFLLNPFYPNSDPQVEIQEYERTFQQNEDLGINDMKV